MTYGIIDLQVSLRCAWDSQSSFYNSWRTVTEIIALLKYSTSKCSKVWWEYDPAYCMHHTVVNTDFVTALITE